MIGRVLDAGEVIWSKHALHRMLERGVKRADIFEILKNGEKIEIYPEDRPWPSALFLGWSDIRPIHVVAAMNPHAAQLAIITVYEPTSERFGADFRTRGKG